MTPAQWVATVVELSTAREVARAAGVSDATVSAWVARARSEVTGVPLPPTVRVGQPSPERLEAIKAWAAQRGTALIDAAGLCPSTE